jgi:hypothetical protein
VRARDVTDDCDSGEGFAGNLLGEQKVDSRERFGELWPGEQQEAVVGKRI